MTFLTTLGAGVLFVAVYKLISFVFRLFLAPPTNVLLLLGLTCSGADMVPKRTVGPLSPAALTVSARSLRFSWPKRVLILSLLPAMLKS
jgi:hypothetical protein